MQDEILKEIEGYSNFINPYLKQFKQHLKGNKVLEINSQKGIYTNKLKEIGLNITGINSDDISEQSFIDNSIKILKHDLLTSFEDLGMFDGVLIINQLRQFDEDKLRILFDNIYNILKEDGMLFLVNNRKYNEKDTILYLMKLKYELVEEFIGDANWNFFLYKKNTIK